MADLDSLIGSPLSLISQQDVRYDGVLFSINAAESSIALSQVKCFGTEDRPASAFVAASPDILPFVTFPGSEIKDLFVHESRASASANAQIANTPPTSAAVQQEKTSGQQQRSPRQPRQQNDRKPQPQLSDKPPPPPSQVQQSERRQPQAPQEDRRRGGGRGAAGREGSREAGSGRGRGRESGRGGSGSSAGTGEHLLKLRQRGGGPPGEAAPVGEFDFSAGLNNFNKEEVLATVAETKRVEVKPDSKYKKDDFFDMLSCDLLGQSSRLSGREERALNQDTFGAVALQNNFSGYRRGGGRGGGGRGRGGYRGRGYGRGQGGRGGAPAAPVPSA